MGDLGYQQAERYALAFDQLSRHDCIVLRMAEESEESILLSGDSTLRRIAMNKSIEIHGVIWVLDQLHHHSLVPVSNLISEIQTWLDDPLVFLPRDDLIKIQSEYSQE